MEYPNWFTGNVPNFEKCLSEYKNKESHFLQLGVYTGDASIWLCENILLNEHSTLTDVDIWDNDFTEAAYDGFDWKSVELIYDQKIERFKNKINKKREDSEVFSKNNKEKNKYDFIYIDAEHTAKATLINGINSYDLCKNGGIIAFDDYEWEKESDLYLRPKKGIDAFLKYFEGNLEIILKNYQLWVKVHK
jgi:predicted O-methyltransferase YrrM